MKNLLIARSRNRLIISLCMALLAGPVTWAQQGREFVRPYMLGPGRPDNAATEFIQSFDADGDGLIDKTEFLKASEALFQLMDLSGDGKLDAEEARRDPAAMYGSQVRWATQVIDRYDTDEDGKLSAEESPFGAMAFARCDTNKDNRLDRRELTQFAFDIGMLSDSLRTADSPTKVAQAFLKKYDKNRDGRIAPDEFEWGEDLFTQYDRNSDKFLDWQEIGRLPNLPRSPQSQAKELMKQCDKDGNGLLSAEELGYPPDRFHAADANGDGQISLDELTTAFAQMFSPVRSKREKRLDLLPEPGRAEDRKAGMPPVLLPGPVGPPVPVVPPAVVAPITKPTTSTARTK